MADLKSFASLAPGLLARKGGARPAMRGGMQALNFPMDFAPDYDDDLGWNDMGEDVGHDHDVEMSSPVFPIGGSRAVALDQMPIRQHRPEVIVQRETMAQRVAGKAKPAPVSRRSAIAEGRRAAFTLRVDAERHLRLRLACTVKGVSAQQIVTEALDRLLDDLPEVASIAKQMKSKR